MTSGALHRGEWGRHTCTRQQCDACLRGVSSYGCIHHTQQCPRERIEIPAASGTGWSTSEAKRSKRKRLLGVTCYISSLAVMDNFAAGLLAKFNKNTAAAEKARAVEAKKARAAAEAVREREIAAEKTKAAAEADKMLKRAARGSGWGGRKETGEVARKKSDLAAEKRARAEGGGVSRARAARVSGDGRGGDKVRKKIPRKAEKKPALDPSKPLPGMEFVVRGEKKKKIDVPHPSDFSDLFGEQYLVGCDNVKAVTSMVKESAKATKEAEKFLAAKKAKAKRLLKSAEEEAKYREDMAKKGIKVDRFKFSENDWRKEDADTWVAVNVAIPTYQRSPNPASMSGSQARASAAAYAKASTSANPTGKTSKAKAKAAAAAVEKLENERRAKALRERVLSVTGGSFAASRTKDQSPARAPHSQSPALRRSENSTAKRRRRDAYASDDDDRPQKRSRGYNSDEWSDADDYAPQKRSRGYNSDEWSDYGSDDDDSDSDGETGFAALQREEERSARLAALEDRRENRAELRRKKEKELRRKQFEESRRNRH